MIIQIPYKIVTAGLTFKELEYIYWWYRLSNLYKEKSIHNWRHRKQEIASRLSISKDKLYRITNYLKARDLVFIENNILRIRNKFSLFPAFGIERKSYTKFIKVKINDYEDFQLELMKIRRSQIEFRQFQTLHKKVVGNISSNRIRRKMMRLTKAKAITLYDRLKNNLSYNFGDDGQKFGFLDSNMSAKTISKLLGYKSKTTSGKVLNKLKDKGKIRLESRILSLGQVKDNNDFNHIKAALTQSCIISSKQGYWSIGKICTRKWELTA